MGKHFFDYLAGCFGRSISSKFAMNNDGDFLIRINDKMALDMDTDEIHLISGWDNDDDDNLDEDESNRGILWDDNDE